MKVALLGGSFDPIHKGHIQMAVYAKKQLQVDEVWFVVAKHAPIKATIPAPYALRKAMVEKSITAYRHFKVCDVEEHLEEKSYTIHTISILKKQFPNYSFYFIMGEDQVSQLHLWKDIDILQEQVQLCAFNRNGKQVTSTYMVQTLEMPDYDSSSTQIRKGHLLHVPKPCHSVIHSHLLYYEFVKEYMSEYRYHHSVRVAQLCKSIAIANGLDGHKAYVAGLLHDIGKEFSFITKEESEIILEHKRPALLEMHPSIWHGYISSYICAHSLYIKDKDILYAIEHHVLGKCRNKYAMVVYVADKLDPQRKYETQTLINLCKKNIYLGFQAVHEQQNAYYSNKEN